MSGTALYRLYDQDGRLMYVGISSIPEERWRGHRRDKPWWPQVARKSVEWHATLAAARAAERSAIKTELPVHNVQHHPVNGPEFTRRQQAKAAKTRLAAPPLPAQQVTLSDLYADRDLTDAQVRRLVALLGLATPRRTEASKGKGNAA